MFLRPGPLKSVRHHGISRQGASDDAAQDITSDQAPTVAGATTILCAGALRQRDPKLFRGIGDDEIEDWLDSVGRILVVKAPATVSEVIDICQNFSELRLQRLPAKRKLEPPTELASLTTAIEGSVDEWAELRNA
ncbi:hypothetical protein HPB47_026835 [Ixodes persulcatus]|uniref:Uncharacterized protein n=1 Tax=Ixodes persulcatus TaxID=34615 RepID=A0AC60PY73_IXOPE|nr:hypothetical protein HPB47_026835 [Ixodes persulcatus]